MAGKEYLEKLNLGIKKISKIANTEVGVVMATFADETITKMKSLAPKAEGTLAASIAYKFAIKEGVVEIDFLADDYWDYINSGVDGFEQSAGAIPNQYGTTYSFAAIGKTQSSGINFKESISLWMMSRGITADDGDQESLAFVIMQSIKRRGIAPTEFVNKTLTEEAINEFASDLADAFVKLL